MSAVTREQLQAILGNACPVPPPVASGTQEIFVSSGTFDKLLDYWKTLSSEARPRLRGVTVAATEGKLALLLSSGKGATVLLTAERGSAVHVLRELWPFAVWWEDELSRFAGISMPERRERGGVAWLRN